MHHIKRVRLLDERIADSLQIGLEASAGALQGLAFDFICTRRKGVEGHAALACLIKAEGGARGRIGAQRHCEALLTGL